MEIQITYLILAMAGMFPNPVFSGGGPGPGPGKPVILPAGDRGILEVEQGKEQKLECYSVSPRSIGYSSNIVWRYGQEEVHPKEKGSVIVEDDNPKWKTTSWCKIKPQQDLYVVCSVYSKEFPELKNSSTLHLKVVNKAETVDSGLGLGLVILAILVIVVILSTLTIGFIYRKLNHTEAHTEEEAAPLEKKEDSTANDMENQCSVRCVTAKRRRGY